MENLNSKVILIGWIFEIQFIKFMQCLNLYQYLFIFRILGRYQVPCDKTHKHYEGINPNLFPFFFPSSSISAYFTQSEESSEQLFSCGRQKLPREGEKSLSFYEKIMIFSGVIECWMGNGIKSRVNNFRRTFALFCPFSLQPHTSLTAVKL